MVLAVDVADAAGMQQGGRRGSNEEIGKSRELGS
jgi:hypothetical protein